jgi:hypothetical protein
MRFLAIRENICSVYPEAVLARDRGRPDEIEVGSRVEFTGLGVGCINRGFRGFMLGERSEQPRGVGIALYGDVLNTT